MYVARSRVDLDIWLIPVSEAYDIELVDPHELDYLSITNYLDDYR